MDGIQLGAIFSAWPTLHTSVTNSFGQDISCHAFLLGIDLNNPLTLMLPKALFFPLSHFFLLVLRFSLGEQLNKVMIATAEVSRKKVTSPCVSRCCSISLRMYALALYIPTVSISNAVSAAALTNADP